MTPETLFAELSRRYGAEPDYPWTDYADYAIFRHTGNRKWFCLYMPVPSEKLGLAGTAVRPVVNVKCRPENTGALRKLPGILPAYHMNKEHWLSLLLDEADEQTVWQLVDDSFSLTR